MKKLLFVIIALLAASPLLHGAAAPAAPPAAAATAAKGTPIPLTTVPIIPSESSLAIRSRTTIPITRLPGYNASLWIDIPAIRAAIANYVTTAPANIIQEYLGDINPLSAWNTPTAQATEYRNETNVLASSLVWLDDHTLAFISYDSTYSLNVWNTTTNIRNSIGLGSRLCDPPTVAYNQQTKLFAVGSRTTVHLIDKDLRIHQTFSCADVATYINRINWSPNGTGLAIMANALEHTQHSPHSILITYEITTNLDNTEIDVTQVLRHPFRPPRAKNGYEYLNCWGMHYVAPTIVTVSFMAGVSTYWNANNTDIEATEIHFNTINGNTTEHKQTYAITSERTYDEASHALLHIDGAVKDLPDEPNLYEVNYTITAHDSLTGQPHLACIYTGRQTIKKDFKFWVHDVKHEVISYPKQPCPNFTKILIIRPQPLLLETGKYTNSICIIAPVPAT